MSSYFHESFDNGIGALTRTWGNGIDTSVKGQVTISGYSGIMEQYWGSSWGHGYGTYTITAKLDGHAPGPAALLWPSNDRWPGQEYDLVEFIDGRPYGTVHWDNGGSDGWRSIYYDGLNESQVHTYSMDWQPGRITFYVDGREWGSVSGDQIGRDYDHGGTNVSFSIMNSNPATSITVYDISYNPSGGGSYAAPETTETGEWTEDATDTAVLTDYNWA